eukprot:TRINITY_DN28409_c0_g1_i1.p1 TRINITY_DN28409_c0_g1~~TRINITY_DN28409_c0_g1_i1.p1  ORF type:complete len:110 (+),score=24.08 TRINITY_DN28409_c0_g1_i1:43-372(+)
MSLNLTGGGGQSLNYAQEFGGNDDDNEEKKRYQSAFSLVDRYANEFKVEQERLRAIEDRKLQKQEQEQKVRAKEKRSGQWCWGHLAPVTDGVKWALGARVSGTLFGSKG